MVIETIKTLLLVDPLMKWLRSHLCKDQSQITYCEKCRTNSYIRLKTRFNGRDIVTIFACPECESHFEKAEDREIVTPLEEYKELVETLKTKYKVKFDDDKPVVGIIVNRGTGKDFTHDY
mgnify:CR=1 FL=1